MAQAAQIVSLPVEKLTFTAEVINLKKVLAKYDDNRSMVAIAMTTLTKSPAEMKKFVAKMEAAGDLPDDIVSITIDNYSELAADFEALAGLIRSAAARMTVVQQRLI
jgi:hypothetical protein